MVLVKPSCDARLDTGNIQRTVVRRFTTNEKAAFSSALSHVRWEHLYAMATCEEQFNFFQRTMEELMDTYFPYKSVTRHTADKPWVTDYFRHLVRQRQRAIMSGDIDEARRMRNLEIASTILPVEDRCVGGHVFKRLVETYEESDGGFIQQH